LSAHASATDFRLQGADRPLDREPAGLPAFPDPRARRICGFVRTLADSYTGGQPGEEAGRPVIMEVVDWDIPGCTVDQAAAFYRDAATKAGFTAVPEARNSGNPMPPTTPSDRIFLRPRHDGSGTPAQLTVHAAAAGGGVHVTVRLITGSVE
jgi:hypothetical protein